jgi:hypothetical protein
VWYGIGRAFLETLRLDPAELLLGIRVNVWGSLAAIVLGVIIVVVQGRRHPGSEAGPYRSGQEWVPEPGVDSEDDYFVVTDESSSDDDKGVEPPATSQPVRSP